MFEQCCGASAADGKDEPSTRTLFPDLVGQNVITISHLEKYIELVAAMFELSPRGPLDNHLRKHSVQV